MTKITIRKANPSDLPFIIQLLADDPLGANREEGTSQSNVRYLNAWNEISNNKNSEIYVVVDDSNIIGAAQIDYLQYLTYRGGRRAQIEGVRIQEKYRNKGVGKKLLQFLIAEAKHNNCHLVQLTTDETRLEALKFYKKLGFEQSHAGMKLHF